MDKKLYKIKDGGMISGVCNGLAVYFNQDVTLVRAIFVLLTLTGVAPGILLYIVLAVILPNKD